MQSLSGGTPVASFMAWGEALSGKISRLSLLKQLILVKIRMFIPFFLLLRKKISHYFCIFAPELDK
ncbi:hypothetical protein DW830_14815 [Prevotella sp. AM34-19LB]|nr:hypothetical protein DW830_14815 [Prevotella sp. AM34-19LB]